MEMGLNHNFAFSNTVAYQKRIMESHKFLWRVGCTCEWVGICRQVLASYLLNMIHTRI